MTDTRPDGRPEDLHGATADQIRRWDKDHVWHPFTPMGPYMDGDPVVVVRGEGRKLQDLEGKWYWDGSSSIWLNVHGHHHPDLDQSIRDQLERIAHSTQLGQGSVPSAVLAKRLVDLAPEGLSRVFFSDSGATAVEIALKAAIQWFANQGESKRNKIIGFTNNYHGDTMGAMGVAPYPAFHWPFLHLLPDQPRVQYPYWYHGPKSVTNDSEAMDYTISELDRTFEQQGSEIAGIIVEPVEGAGGICPAPPGFLRALRERCDRHGALLIVDEVATGFGKTGTMFACEQEGITPDLLCLGKGLTAGYLPVAATLATNRVFEQFLGERRRTLFHGHSFTGNQLGCAVALANLDLMPAVMEALPPKIEHVHRRLEAFRSMPLVGDVRARGFMTAFELALDPETRTPIPAEKLAGYRVTDRARELGLLVRPIGNAVIFMPPLSSTIEELDAMLDILELAAREALDALAAELRSEGLLT